jgi:transposase
VKHPSAETSNVPTHMNVILPTTMGLDLSDRVSTYHVQRGDGQTLVKGKVNTVREALSTLFTKWKGCRLVIEVGTHSPWISRLGQECGMEVLVANPRKVKEISASNRKTDSNDAEILADVGRTTPKRLFPVTHRSKQAQVDLTTQRARVEVVRLRTALINFVRGVMKSHGYRAPSSSAESFAKRMCTHLPQELESALRPMLETLSSFNAQIAHYEKQLTKIERVQPIVRQFQAIPGVGPITSVTFALTIDDPTRFKGARQMGAYMGIVPRLKDSGESSPQLGITKAGDCELRRLLVLGSHYILGPHGPDCDLRRFGLRLLGNGNKRGSKKRAVVAVARKLSVLLCHLWLTGEEYDPFYLAKLRGEAVPVSV